MCTRKKKPFLTQNNDVSIYEWSSEKGVKEHERHTVSMFQLIEIDSRMEFYVVWCSQEQRVQTKKNIFWIPNKFLEQFREFIVIASDLVHPIDIH